MKKVITSFLTCFLCFAIFAQSETKTDSIQSDKKVSFVGIPMFNYSNSFGASLGVFVSAFYNVSASDTISPLSSSGIFANYSSNKTWFAAQINKLYLNEDKIRVNTAIGVGNINFQVYAEYPNFPEFIPVDFKTGNSDENENDDDGTFVDYKTQVQFIYAESLFRVVDNFYLGGQFVFSHVKTEFDLPGSPVEDLNQFGFGIATELDSRDNQFLPTTGKRAEFGTLTFLEDLGSTNSYTKLDFNYNQYFSLRDRDVILARFYGALSLGDVPFSGKNIVGRDDLRGYSSGKYRADQVYNIQSEYRHWFSDKWAYVAFGGIATAIDGFDELAFDKLLPAVGAGIRFLAIPSKKITVGIDVAVGKDDWGLYFRISEAFTR